MRTRRFPILLSLAAILLALVACGGDRAGPDTTGPQIRMATTTSTRDSGLLDVLLPAIERDTGVRVSVLAVGSGQALRAGGDGDADILFTHAPEGELALVASGAASERIPLMYNDFVIVGPPGDTLGLGQATDVREALRRIVENGHPFLSRGDDSGTHRKELELWKQAGVEPVGEWHRETGQGMGATLAMAAESGAITLVDRSTWSAHARRDEIPILFQGDARLRNPYAILLISAERHPHVQAGAAREVAGWLTGAAGRRAIEEFAPRGEQLFFLLEGGAGSERE